jgi:uncharacterized protein (DUF58 family)
LKNIAGLALTTASGFLAVVAVLIAAPALFYITTALIVTIFASHFQAWLSVRGLRFERVAPESVRAGERVTVELTVWSERKIRRPLITIQDQLPAHLLLGELSPSLPIAPSYDVPIRTQYQMRPLKRGRYRWSGVIVEGTDALGLITKQHEYETAPTEMTVLPAPIPIALDMPSARGWGIDEAHSGSVRGAGLEPRGVREYVPGDAQRHIHWKLSARAGKLLVKEFEAGTQSSAAFVIQRTRGSEVGDDFHTTLETMCGNVAFLAERFLREGAVVRLPQVEPEDSFATGQERVREIYEGLATLAADVDATTGQEVEEAIRSLGPGSALIVLVAVRDESLPSAIRQAVQQGAQVVALVYDVEAYVKDPRQIRAIPQASDPDFIESMRAAGATTELVRGEGERTV